MKRLEDENVLANEIWLEYENVLVNEIQLEIGGQKVMALRTEFNF